MVFGTLLFAGLVITLFFSYPSLALLFLPPSSGRPVTSRPIPTQVIMPTATPMQTRTPEPIPTATPIPTKIPTVTPTPVPVCAANMNTKYFAALVQPGPQPLDASVTFKTSPHCNQTAYMQLNLLVEGHQLDVQICLVSSGWCGTSQRGSGTWVTIPIANNGSAGTLSGHSREYTVSFLH